MINVAQLPKVEQDIRIIYGKLPVMTDREIGLVAAFVRGLKIKGVDMEEYNREIPPRAGKE